MHVLSNLFLTFSSCLLCLICVAMQYGHTAEFILNNGQTIHGTIIQNNDDGVIIGLGVDGTQGRITLATKDVKEIHKTAADTLSTEQTGKISDVQSTQVYGYIRIRGRIGQDIRAGGLKAALVLARRKGISHIVFEVNGSGEETDAGIGDIDETARIGKVLADHRGLMKFHVLAINCRGLNLIFPLYAHSIHMNAGGIIGGGQPITQMSNQELTLRADLANRAQSLARKNGKLGTAYAAMIDPRLRLCLWLDEQGKVQYSPNIPAGLSADKVIVQTNEKSLLVMSDAHVQKAGLKVVQGIEGVIDVLGLESLQKSAELEEAYQIGSAAAHKRQQRADAIMQQKIQKNIQRRYNATQVLSHAMEQAKKHDPVDKNYATVGSWQGHYWSYTKGQGAGRANYRANDYTGPQQFTVDSRSTWQRNSDITIRYLNDAIQAATSLIEIEKKNEKIGIDSIFAEVKLNSLVDSLQIKLQTLYAQRNKKSK